MTITSKYFNKCAAQIDEITKALVILQCESNEEVKAELEGAQNLTNALEGLLSVVRGLPLV